MSGALDLTGRYPLWDRPELAIWRRAAVRALAEVDPSLRTAPGGELMLREELGRLLGASPAAITITSGVRAAAAPLMASCREVLVERPTFLGVVRALRTGGVAVGQREWEDLAEGARPGRGVWLTTPCRNPDGRTADRELLAVLAEAADRGCRVVCNGAYRWFDPAPEPPDGLLRVGTLHKLAGPGACLGWVIGTEPAGAKTGGAKTAGAKTAGAEPAGACPAGTLPAPPLHWQRTWGLFLAAGGLEPLLDRHRRLSAARAAFLAAAGLVDGGTGPNVLVRVTEPESAVVAGLAAAGVLVSPGAAFAAPWPAIRICLAGVPAGEAAAAGDQVRRVLDYQLVNGNCAR